MKTAPTAESSNSNRAAIYCRVSREEQVQGYSLDAQARASREYAAGKAWTIVAEYREEGRSARTDVIARRPEFRRLLDDVRAGKVDVVIVHKVDRFARNLRISFEALDILARAGVAFVSVTEQVDYSTPQGRVFLGMLALWAQFYSDNLGQEVHKGKQERKAQGLYNGLLPFGVLKGEDGVPAPDPATHPGLILAFEQYAAGYTDRKVAQLLNERGYRTAGNMGSERQSGGRGGNLFTKDTVRGLLINRFYLGELPNGTGGWLPGRQQPFVDAALFAAVQEERERRRTTPVSIRQSARTYSLSAMMRCRQCGGRMRVAETVKGRVRFYCRSKAQGLGCGATGTFLDVYEAQLASYLAKFQLPADYQARILAMSRQMGPEQVDTERERRDLTTRLERTRRLFQWGDIGETEYRRTKDEIQRKLRALAPQADASDALAKLRVYLDELPRAWEDATQEQRNRLLKVVLEAVWVENEKVVAVRPRPEFQPFLLVGTDTSVTSTGTGDPDGHWSRISEHHFAA